jgi:hypothetical protein
MRAAFCAALRGLIEAIILTPSHGTLEIELKGNLTAMLMLAPTVAARESGRPTAGFGPDFAGPQNAKGRPKQATFRCKVVLVAGGSSATASASLLCSSLGPYLLLCLTGMPNGRSSLGR